jgi:hypothetical protein
MIEVWWMPGTFVSSAILKEINQQFLKEIKQTMYSTKTATTNNEEFTSSYMPVGINEDVTIKEVNVNKAPNNGKDFLEIVFENASGQTATMTEWKNEKNIWIKTDEDLQNRDNQQFGRILQVIDAAKGSHGDFEGTSFIEMINWAKNQLAGENSKVRIKVCYNKKGYTRVSNLGIFIEPMSVQESQIKLFKNDLMERPIVADVETAADPLAGNGAPVTADSNTGADNLPF